MLLPKGYAGKEGSKKLAQRLRLEVDAAIRARDPRLARHDRLLSLYLNEPPAPKEKAFEGASEAHLNLMQVKTDAMGTHVMSAITSSDLYCVAQTFTLGQESTVIERVTQFFLDKAGLKQHLSAANRPATLYNTGIIKVDWSGGDLPGLDNSAVEVHDFVMYPATRDEIKDARLVGDRFWLMRSTIDELMASGTYEKFALGPQKLSEGDPGQKRGENEPSVSGHIPHETAGFEDNAMVELFDLTFKMPLPSGKTAWWRAVLAYQDQLILKISLHDMDRPGYMRVFYKSEKGEFWSKSTVGNDLQGVQLAVNDLVRRAEDGLTWNIYGAFFVPGAFGDPSAYGKVKPGDMKPIDSSGPMVPYNPKADLTFVPQLLQFYVDYADQVVRIPQSATGAAPNKGVTATAEALANAGKVAGINDYLSNAYVGVVDVFAYSHTLLTKKIEEWWDKYAQFLGLPPEAKQALALPAEWKPNTQTVGATPSAQLQTIQMVREQGAIPGSSIDLYSLETKILQTAERMGLNGATMLQTSMDIQQAVQVIAQRAGMDPAILMLAMQRGEQITQVLQEAAMNKQVEEIGEAVAGEDSSTQGE